MTSLLYAGVLYLFNIHHLDWDFVDIFRVVLILFCFALVGNNVAFFVHIPHIFPHEARRSWRLFFISKSLITMSVAFSVWRRVEHDMPIHWSTWLAAAGVILANISLFLLWKLKRKHNGAMIVME